MKQHKHTEYSLGYKTIRKWKNQIIKAQSNNINNIANNFIKSKLFCILKTPIINNEIKLNMLWAFILL